MVPHNNPVLRTAKEWYDVSSTGPTRSWPSNGVAPSPFHRGRKSPLRDIHLVGDSPQMVKIDLAHTYAIVGFGKDHLASVLVFVSVRCRYFGGTNQPDQLKLAFAAFTTWCAQNKRYTTIREFDYTVLKITSLPGLSCGTSFALFCHDSTGLTPTTAWSSSGLLSGCNSFREAWAKVQMQVWWAHGSRLCWMQCMLILKPLFLPLDHWKWKYTWAYQIISVSLGISRSLNFNFQNCCTAPVFKH